MMVDSHMQLEWSSPLNMQCKCLSLGIAQLEIKTKEKEACKPIKHVMTNLMKGHNRSINGRFALITPRKVWKYGTMNIHK